MLENVVAVREKRAVVRPAELDLLGQRPPVVHAQHRLRPGLDPLDGPLDGSGEPADQQLLHVVAALASERASHVRHDHPHTLLREAEDAGEP
jgi:hypothetical protein